VGLKQLTSELRQIVASIGKLPADCDATADLYSDLGFGSFLAVDLLIELEERYE
jgi:acyl carrier protein